MPGSVIPRALGRAARRREFWSVQTLRLLWAGVRTMCRSGEHHSRLLAEYPAHLHINLDPAFRGLGLGNVMQFEQIQQVCSQGLAVYDLGGEVPYKHRWGEMTFATDTLFVLRR